MIAKFKLMVQRKIKRSRTIYTLLLAVCIIGFWVFENFYNPSTYSNPEYDGKKTVVDHMLVPSSTTNSLAEHNFYMLSYSEGHEQAEWVAYELKKEHLTYDDRERPYFIEDPKISSKSADWRNYKGSGYDRGHLCPAGDRRFSEYAYNETFYTSNIAPQNRDFNAGVWNRLEKQVRQWCKSYGDLFIVTGGILERDLEEIGEEDVDVPNMFYKIVYRKAGKQGKALAFLMPNKESKQPLDYFLVSIDEIEKRTGIDFFYQQDLDWQRQLETKINKSGWSF